MRFRGAAAAAIATDADAVASSSASRGGGPLARAVGAAADAVVGALASLDEALEARKLLPRLERPAAAAALAGADGDGGAAGKEFREVREQCFGKGGKREEGTAESAPLSHSTDQTSLPTTLTLYRHPSLESQTQTLAKLRQLKLDDAAVVARERARHARGKGAVPAPWWIRAPFWALCSVLDLLFVGRPLQRFWVLETVARIPYFSAISLLHLYESLGFWRAGAELRKVHFAEEWCAAA